MQSKQLSKASLVVVGSGIKFLSHLTIEAKTYIEQSEKVLYLVNEPLMKEWIQKANPHAESLDHLYFKYSLRSKCYREITNYILETLRNNHHVCVVLYGHPTFFSQPALDAVIQAKKEGYFAKILPGISAEDCLFADLMINPGVYGCQSFDATEFLVHMRRPDTQSHLILWQVGSVGLLNHQKEQIIVEGINELVNYLIKFYEAQHEVMLYEASQYPHVESKVINFPLSKLPKMILSGISTLYIPPVCKPSCNKEMLSKLGMQLDDLL